MIRLEIPSAEEQNMLPQDPWRPLTQKGCPLIERSTRRIPINHNIRVLATLKRAHGAAPQQTDYYFAASGVSHGRWPVPTAHIMQTTAIHSPSAAFCQRQRYLNMNR